MTGKEIFDWSLRAVITVVVTGAIAWGAHINTTQTAQAVTLATVSVQAAENGKALDRFQVDVKEQLNRIEAKQDASILRELGKGVK
jgi:anion-transporting  ArsA/GET3 family ATPase